MRIATVILSGLSISMLLSVPVCADPLEIAKVYRDYPGYINPAVCDNPNLGTPPATATPAAPEGTASQPAPAAEQTGSCSAVPYDFRSDDPVNIPYLTLWAGVVTTHDNDIDYGTASSTVSFDNGYGAGAAIGYDFGPSRLEIEGSYREADADDADEDLEVMTLLVNAYADFKTGGMVTPYLGAGVGYAEVEAGDYDDEVFAGQLAAGMLFALSPKVAVDLGYRFLITDNPEVKDVELEEVKQHAATLGLQVRF
jgi:opacity protein-like surface antigen